MALSTNPPKTEHRQLRDVAADQLRGMIARGELAPGEWLRQEKLAAALGVSYTPIREALKQLEAEGLVEHVPYRGVRVIEFSADDVLDIYTMRSELEGLAAAAAAIRITPDQLTELRALHQGMADAGSDQLSLVRELNRRFHTLVIAASGRTYLIRTLGMIWSWFPTMLWSQFTRTARASAPNREQADNIEHAEIVAALEAHDAARAQAAMREHIDHARQTLVAFLADQPDQTHSENAEQG